MPIQLLRLKKCELPSVLRHCVFHKNELISNQSRAKITYFEIYAANSIKV